MTGIYLFFTVVFASTIQAVSGFGFNIVGAPLLMLFIAPKEVISLTIVGALLLNLMVIHKTRGQGDNSIILPMFFASMVGVLPGVYLLHLIDASLLKLVVGLVVILMSLALAADFSVPIKRQRLASIIAGGLGGFMGGATSMSGPVVAMFLMNQKQDKVAFRANLVRFFCLNNIVILGTMYFMGVMEADVLPLVSYIVPGVLLGTWLGERAFHRVSPAAFRHVVVAVLISCGLMSVAPEIVKQFH